MTDNRVCSDSYTLFDLHVTSFYVDVLFGDK